MVRKTKELVLVEDRELDIIYRSGTAAFASLHLEMVSGSNAFLQTGVNSAPAGSALR